MSCVTCTPTGRHGGLVIASGATVFTRDRLHIDPPHTVADVTGVGVFHDKNRNASPAVADFDPAQLIDGVTNPADPLAWPGRVDIVYRVGPDGDTQLTPGRWWRWLLISTVAEHVIVRTPTPITVI